MGSPAGAYQRHRAALPGAGAKNQHCAGQNVFTGAQYSNYFRFNASYEWDQRYERAVVSLSELIKPLL